METSGKKKWAFKFALSFALFIIVLYGLRIYTDQYKLKVYKMSEVDMGTVVTLTVVAQSPEAANKAIDLGFAEVKYLDRLLSIFNKDSEVSQINLNAGIRPVKVSWDTFRVITRSIEVAGYSHGAFDPTIGPLSTLWDFINHVKPSPQAIKSRLHLINYKNIIMDDSRMTVMLKHRGMSLDLGGIAKGYAADRVAKAMESVGINSGIAALAGDIKTFGGKPHSKGWMVGIKDPRGGPEAIKGVLMLQNLAVSTAGDYERFFIEDGVRYHHILDPKTGYPAMEFQGVTIVDPLGAMADGLDTAIFVLGREKGMALVRRMNLRAFVVFSDGTTYATENLKDIFTPEADTKKQ